MFETVIFLDVDGVLNCETSKSYVTAEDGQVFTGIDAACCAGSTPEWHEKTLDILEHCHFNVINRKKEW